jgi:hypothetical protein
MMYGAYGLAAAPFDERVLNGMGVLTAIVDSGSFGAAGELLDMSQSGVSRSIARLEARRGIRPFDRTTRSRYPRYLRDEAHFTV